MKLKFLADVNVEKSVIDLVRETECDIIWIAETNLAMRDNEILDLANKEDRILITNDKDFGELVFWQKKVTIGIILFRVKGQDTQKKCFLFRELLRKFEDKIRNNFVIISDNKFRFIPLKREE